MNLEIAHTKRSIYRCLLRRDESFSAIRVVRVILLANAGDDIINAFRNGYICGNAKKQGISHWNESQFNAIADGFIHTLII